MTKLHQPTDRADRRTRRWVTVVVLLAMSTVAACDAPAATTPSPTEALTVGSTELPSPSPQSTPPSTDDPTVRSEGCRSLSIAADVSAAAPSGAPVPLPAPLLPGETTGARLLLYSLRSGSERRDAIVDVDRNTVTPLDTDTACGSYHNTVNGPFGSLYAPKGFADGRTQYKARWWHADGSSVAFDLPGNDTSIVLGTTWWGLSSTDETPQLTSVELATGKVAAWGDAPDRSSVLVGHDADGRPVVSTNALGTFAFDPTTRAFLPLTTTRTIYWDSTQRIEYDCSAGRCDAVYRSDAVPDVDLGLAPYLHVTPSPDGRYMLLVAYNTPIVPVDVFDTSSGRRIHLADEEQGIGPVVWASWSNDGNWLFMLEAGTRRFVAWKPGMSAPRAIGGADHVLADFAGIGTLPHP